jgi:hypothetical protein
MKNESDLLKGTSHKFESKLLEIGSEEPFVMTSL